jgi:hypothetical protein
MAFLQEGCSILQADVDECASAPCKNGQRCVDGADAFTVRARPRPSRFPM